jgi:hypothetical protein
MKLKISYCGDKKNKSSKNKGYVSITFNYSCVSGMNCFLLQFLAGFDGLFKLAEVVFYLPDIYRFHNRKFRR